MKEHSPIILAEHPGSSLDLVIWMVLNVHTVLLVLINISEKCILLHLIFSMIATVTNIRGNNLKQSAHWADGLHKDLLQADAQVLPMKHVFSRSFVY